MKRNNNDRQKEDESLEWKYKTRLLCLVSHSIYCIITIWKYLETTTFSDKYSKCLCNGKLIRVVREVTEGFGTTLYSYRRQNTVWRQIVHKRNIKSKLFALNDPKTAIKPWKVPKLQPNSSRQYLPHTETVLLFANITYQHKHAHESVSELTTPPAAWRK